MIKTAGELAVNDILIALQDDLTDIESKIVRLKGELGENYFASQTFSEYEGVVKSNLREIEAMVAKRQNVKANFDWLNNYAAKVLDGNVVRP